MQVRSVYALPWSAVPTRQVREAAVFLLLRQRVQLPMEAVASIVMYTYDVAGVTNEAVAKVAAGGIATGTERWVRRGAVELKAFAKFPYDRGCTPVT